MTVCACLRQPCAGSCTAHPTAALTTAAAAPPPPLLQVRDRKGFVRLAVEAGVPLVPVFHFGNSQLFR